MRRMKATPACAKFNYVSLLSCSWKFSASDGKLAPANAATPAWRPIAAPRIVPASRLGFASGDTGIRDTGQNASLVQDAFRSLHYVAETCLPPSAYPAITTISTPLFGDRPHVAWGQTPKSVSKTPRYLDISLSYRLKCRK